MKRQFFIFVTPLLVAFALGCFYCWQVLNASLLPKGEEVIIEVKPSMTTQTLVDLLNQNHLVQHPRVLLRYIQLKGLAKKFKVGVYVLKGGESVGSLLDKIVRGKVLTQSFTIVEGITFDKLNQMLTKAPYLIHHGDFSFLKKSYPGYEGLVLADTWFYEANSDSRKLLQRANESLMAFLNKIWKERSAGLPYQSPYELLIAASILEKESAIPHERKLISGVIVNRLKKHMPLQMDPTVIYALKEGYKGKLHHADLQVDSPYNTYKYQGLPPTPIAIVGRESILAAAHPVFSSYLYFVANCQGQHIFSSSYEKQKAALSRIKADKSCQNFSIDEQEN